MPQRHDTLKLYLKLILYLNNLRRGNNFIKGKKETSHVTSHTTRRVLKNLITFLRMWNRRLALRHLRQMFPANYTITTHKHASLNPLLSRHPYGTLDIYSNYYSTSTLLFCFKWIFHAHGSKAWIISLWLCLILTKMVFYFCALCIFFWNKMVKMIIFLPK